MVRETVGVFMFERWAWSLAVPTNITFRPFNLMPELGITMCILCWGCRFCTQTTRCRNADFCGEELSLPEYLHFHGPDRSRRSNVNLKFIVKDRVV